MADLTGMMQAAAGGAGGADGSYIAVTHGTTPYLTILDHTTPGTVSLAATYAAGAATNGVAFSPDGAYIGVSVATALRLLSFTAPGTVTLSATYNPGFSGRQVAFSPSGDYIAQVGVPSSGNLCFALYDHTTPGSVSLAGSYFSGSNQMLSVGFSPDGNYIGLGGETPTLSGPYFTLLDHTTPGTVSLAATYNTSRVVRSLDFSLNGSYVATAHSDAPYFTLLNRPTASTLSLAATYTGVAQGNGTAFSPDGNYIVLLCAGASNQIALLDHTTPGSVSLSATYTTSSSAQKAKFTPSGNYIAVANQATGGAPQFTLLSHNAGSIALAASYVLAGNAIDVSISPV